MDDRAPGLQGVAAEIEAQLRALPELSQCLVVTREDRPGDVRLVAYVVATEGSAIDTVRLKDHLRARLPDYMLPQHYVPLQTLPLLPNGKIDRHALPAPLSEQRARRQVRSADRTPAEAALAGVWAEVLGMDPDEIDPRDNFFDLGGDSLKAGRTVIHFERSSGVRLETQRLIFETLAQMVGGIELSDARAPAPAAEPAGGSWLKRLFKLRP